MKQELLSTLNEQSLKNLSTERLFELYCKFRNVQLRYFLVEYKMIIDELQSRIRGKTK